VALPDQAASVPAEAAAEAAAELVAMGFAHSIAAEAPAS